MKQEEYSPKQTAAMKSRVRRMREQFRKRLIVASIIFFILGAVAGVFAHRWYVERTPDTLNVYQAVTPPPTPGEVTLAQEATPEAWAMPDDAQPSDEDGDIFPEDEDGQEDGGAELDVFPEVDSQQLTDNGEEAEKAQDQGGTGLLIAPGEKLEPQTGTEGDAEAQQPAGEEADGQSDAVAEPESNGAPQAEDAAAAQDASEGDDAPQAEDAAAAQDALEGDDAPQAEDAATEANDGAEIAEAADPDAEAQAQAAGYGPQVVAIVPYGESFTYTTEINAEGNARVEATDEPYETVCFMQTMKDYMRPTDYAAKYATQYKLQGDEAGASFELTLMDYTGTATIIPQNVVDVGLRSESGNTVEHGYQLMDAEIYGKYGIALSTNTPTTFYKRFSYPTGGEDMKYLVITTYKNGQTQMILFELEDDKPEPEAEVIYPVLQRGLVNDDVLNMQNRLVELGYLNVTPDGTFGPKTEEAIKSAQAAFGMEVNGIADNAFQQKLFEGVAPSAGQGVGYVSLSEGSTGDAVVRLQKRLAELGYYNGKADGGYGPKMTAAVKKAQVDFGMEQTGIADSEFQVRAFADAPGTVNDTGYTVLQKGSKGDAVVRLQLSLREQGYYNGRADGGFGQNTVAAVKKAQAAFGMEENGIADVAFQQRLFGSVNAPTEAPAEDGVAAPAEDGEAAPAEEGEAAPAEDGDAAPAEDEATDASAEGAEG